MDKQTLDIARRAHLAFTDPAGARKRHPATGNH